VSKNKELIHSKKIRHLIIQGVFDFSGLFDGNHQWISFARLGIRDPRTSNYKLSKKQLEIKNERKFATSLISFCPDCIEDSIKEYGYGFFKKAWWRNYYCKIHNKNLLIVKDKSKAKLSKSIMNILSGRWQTLRNVTSMEKSDILLFHSKSIKSIKRVDVDLPIRLGRIANRYLSVIKENGNNYQISFCLRAKLLDWFDSNYEKISEELKKYYRCDNLIIFYPEKNDIPLISEFESDDFFLLFVYFLEKEKLGIYEEFLLENTRLIQGTNLVADIASNCQKCPSARWGNVCAASLSILRTRLIIPVLYDSMINKLIAPKEIDTILHYDLIHYEESNKYCKEIRLTEKGKEDIIGKVQLLGWCDINSRAPNVLNLDKLPIDFPLVSESSVWVDPDLDNGDIPFPAIYP
jgi:hypothetical protein